MAAGKYDKCVFVNCPFDDDYTDLFEAILFAIFDCGFIPRCGLEERDAGTVRVEKLKRIIRDCRFGLHDISRVELDRKTGLPRFNMPYELGIFLGAQRYGGTKHRRKICMILERKQYSYQKYISDINGQDPMAHNNDPKKAVAIVRDWLNAAPGKRPIPGATFIWQRYRAFRRDLPKIAKESGVALKEMTYADYIGFITAWLQQTAMLARKTIP
jgi:hypothetical protein